MSAGRSRHDEYARRIRKATALVADEPIRMSADGSLLALLDELAAAEARAAELERELAKFHADAEYTAEVVGTAADSAIDAWEARARAERARADKATQALAAAVAELEVLSEHDRNHDGFDSPAPVDKDNCRLCRAIALARDALGGVSSGTQEPAA